ncbi:MAG: DUF3313 family protein [Magnetospirillum sp.]|nr:DUF3313 family protein [Magnetospirillum sp.]
MRNASVLLAAGAMLLGACANQETTRSGFLRDYGRMAPDASGALVERPAAPSRQPAVRYRAFMVDEVTYLPGKRSEPATETEIAGLRAHFREAAVKAFAQSYTYTETAGPDVLRVRLAITGIDKAISTLNYIATPLVGPLSNGGASSEAEIVDSMTGARLLAFSTHTNATPFKGGLFQYYTSLGHAKSVLARHATELHAQFTTTR